MANHFARKSHSVPEAYLKGWAREDGRVSSYRLLVPHQKYPEWEARSTARLTRYTDLYTSSYSGTDSDQFERWLNEYVEDPAAAALTKVRADEPLSASDWSKLATYAASLDLRTPAAYLEHSERWAREVPKTLEEAMANLDDKLRRAARSGELARTGSRDPRADGFPLKVSRVPMEKGRVGLRAEVVMGREMWLWDQRRLLTSTADVWTKHRWTILYPYPGSQWFTSDHPVVRLNYYAEGHYDFKGGWGNLGTELILALSPRHLMYTKVGSEWRGSKTVSIEHTYQFQKFIAERAFRWIFARGQPRRAPWIRPRRVDREGFLAEERAFKSWDERQRAVELGPAQELRPPEIAPSFEKREQI